MSIVIVGGNERMVCQYEDICKGYGCKFTGTVSHKMVNCAVEEAKKKSIPVCRCHTSSASALESILREYCA